MGQRQDIAFAEYRQAVREGHERSERLTEALRTQTEHWRMKPLVAGSRVCAASTLWPP